MSYSVASHGLRAVPPAPIVVENKAGDEEAVATSVVATETTVASTTTLTAAAGGAGSDEAEEAALAAIKGSASHRPSRTSSIVSRLTLDGVVAAPENPKLVGIQQNAKLVKLAEEVLEEVLGIFSFHRVLGIYGHEQYLEDKGYGEFTRPYITMQLTNDALILQEPSSDPNSFSKVQDQYVRYAEMCIADFSPVAAVDDAGAGTATALLPAAEATAVASATTTVAVDAAAGAGTATAPLPAAEATAVASATTTVAADGAAAGAGKAVAVSSPRERDFVRVLRQVVCRFDEGVFGLLTRATDYRVATTVDAVMKGLDRTFFIEGIHTNLNYIFSAFVKAVDAGCTIDVSAIEAFIQDMDSGAEVAVPECLRPLAFSSVQKYREHAELILLAIDCLGPMDFSDMKKYRDQAEIMILAIKAIGYVTFLVEQKAMYEARFYNQTSEDARIFLATSQDNILGTQAKLLEYLYKMLDLLYKVSDDIHAEKKARKVVLALKAITDRALTPEEKDLLRVFENFSNVDIFDRAEALKENVRSALARTPRVDLIGAELEVSLTDPETGVLENPRPLKENIANTLCNLLYAVYDESRPRKTDAESIGPVDSDLRVTLEFRLRALGVKEDQLEVLIDELLEDKSNDITAALKAEFQERISKNLPAQREAGLERRFKEALFAMRKAVTNPKAAYVDVRKDLATYLNAWFAPILNYIKEHKLTSKRAEAFMGLCADLGIINVEGHLEVKQDALEALLLRLGDSHISVVPGGLKFLEQKMVNPAASRPRRAAFAEEVLSPPMSKESTTARVSQRANQMWARTSAAPAATRASTVAASVMSNIVKIELTLFQRRYFGLIKNQLLVGLQKEMAAALRQKGLSDEGDRAKHAALSKKIEDMFVQLDGVLSGGKPSDSIYLKDNFLEILPLIVDHKVERWFVARLFDLGFSPCFFPEEKMWTLDPTPEYATAMSIGDQAWLNEVDAKFKSVISSPSADRTPRGVGEDDEAAASGGAASGSGLLSPVRSAALGIEARLKLAADKARTAVAARTGSGGDMVSPREGYGFSVKGDASAASAAPLSGLRLTSTVTVADAVAVGASLPLGLSVRPAAPASAGSGSAAGSKPPVPMTQSGLFRSGTAAPVAAALAATVRDDAVAVGSAARVAGGLPPLTRTSLPGAIAVIEREKALAAAAASTSMVFASAPAPAPISSAALTVSLPVSGGGGAPAPASGSVTAAALGATAKPAPGHPGLVKGPGSFYMPSKWKSGAAAASTAPAPGSST